MRHLYYHHFRTAGCQIINGMHNILPIANTYEAKHYACTHAIIRLVYAYATLLKQYYLKQLLEKNGN